MSAGSFAVSSPSAPQTLVAPLPIRVVPLVNVPALFPQLVSQRASMLELPLTSSVPRTHSAQGGSRTRTLVSVTEIRWCALVRRSALTSVGTQPTATTVRSFAAAPGATVRRTPPSAVPGIPMPTGTRTPPSYGAGTGTGSESGSPPLAVGLDRAQTASSTPDSASPRAWATRSWFEAISGSDAERTENATTSAARMSVAMSAAGSATPRSSPNVRFVRRAPIRHLPMDRQQPRGGLLVGTRADQRLRTASSPPALGVAPFSRGKKRTVGPAGWPVAPGRTDCADDHVA